MHTPGRPESDKPPSARRKIRAIASVAESCREARARGETVVHCHGCFDIVHPGHVRHLQHARSLGDRLVVSITADRFVGKGAGRPLFDQALRAENLAALACVDEVCVNDAPTAEWLLDILRPSMYVKGREYEDNNDPRFLAERAAVERHGGRVVFTSGDVVFSSTALVEAMRTGAGAAEDRLGDPVSARLRQLRGVHDLSSLTIARILTAMRGRRVVVIGESIRDTYVHCAWPDVSGEAPVLTLRPTGRTSYDGGAAIIARHAAALGASVALVTLAPESAESEALHARLATERIEMIGVPFPGDHVEKQRFLVGTEKVFKLNASPQTIDASVRTRAVEAAVRAASGADAAIVADFGLGMFSTRMTATLFEKLRPAVRVLAGDVSGRQGTLAAMHGADWLSPSERELRAAVSDHTNSLPAAVWSLARKTEAKNVVVTMAADGLVAFRNAGESPPTELDGNPSRLAGEHIPALAGRTVDTLGCGDALLAAGVLALASGAEPVAAAFIGSLAAAAEAAMLGNGVVSSRDIIRLTPRFVGDSLTIETPTPHPLRRMAV